MKDNKICFNKTLTYLILLIVAVVGAFYVINYANSQKLGGKPRASGSGPPTCPYYRSDMSTVSTVPARRFVALKEGNKCYGFTGRYTRYYQNPTDYPKAGRKVFYATNENDVQYDGCFLEEIKCVIDVPNSEKKDERSCSPNVFKWAPNPTPTGISFRIGSNQFYGFKDICVRQYGYKITTYEADADSKKYIPNFRCRTQAVSEVNCQNIPSRVPTRNPTTGQLPVQSYNKYFDNEENCPKNRLIWRSAIYNTNAETIVWNRVNKASSGSNDICMMLTGKARLVKNPSTGNVEVRCQMYYAPSIVTASQCNGQFKIENGSVASTYYQN